MADRYGIKDGRIIEVDIPPGWAICCDCGDMWLLSGPGHYCVRRLMRETGLRGSRLRPVNESEDIW